MSLKHAIIALLDLEKGTGYDLMKRFNSSIGHFWSSSHQQVYQELGKLNDEGLVEFEAVEQDGKPTKKIYRITPSGLEALQDWLKQPAKGYKFKDPFLIKLYAGMHTSKEALLDELQQHQIEHEKTLADYQKIESGLLRADKSIQKRYLLPYMTMRLGIKFEKAWLEWVEEVREALREAP